MLTDGQDHPELARKAMLLSSVRPGFPSLFWGREREFEAANILAVHGEKHKSLRAAWQPMFFSGRSDLCIWHGNGNSKGCSVIKLSVFLFTVRDAE